MSLSYGFYHLLKEIPNKIYSIFFYNTYNTQNEYVDENDDIDIDNKSFYKKFIQLLYYNYAYGDL